MPMVSVIIPTFNRADTIQRAIHSVLAQTFQDFEIIVVDDGSSDDMSFLVDRFKNQNIRLIKHEVNSGPSAARNTGINASTGQFIAFLDSDDEWMPGKLTRQIALLNHSQDDCGASCTGFTLAYQGMGYSCAKYLPTEEYWTGYLLINGCDLGPGSTLLLRRQIFEETGMFDENLSRYEDWDWLLRYVSHYQLAIAPEPNAIVHLSPPAKSVHLESSIPYFLNRWQDELLKLGPNKYRRLRSTLLLELSKSQFSEGKFDKSVANTLRAFWNWPFQNPRIALSLVDTLFNSHWALRSARRAKTQANPPSPSKQ